MEYTYNVDRPDFSNVLIETPHRWNFAQLLVLQWKGRSPLNILCLMLPRSSTNVNRKFE